MSFDVVFAPSFTGGTQGLLTVGLTTGSLVITLTGTGTASNLTATYTLSDGNTHPLVDGIIITFPSIDITATSTATINLFNQGTGPGTVTNISVFGGGFRLNGIPSFPATVGAGQTLSFRIIFTPSQAGSYSGTFRIDLEGRIITGSLSAATNISNFTASYTLADGNVHPLVDGTAISLPSIDINGTTAAAIDLVNQGQASGAVSGIWLAGTGFRLTGVPPLPATIAAGQTLHIGIVFAPTQVGSFTGSFRIDLPGRSISGSVTASTASPTFTAGYSFADNVVHAITDGTGVTFQAIDLNVTATASVRILNQGEGTGTVTGITLSGTGFRLTGIPLLPATVAPGRSLTLRDRTFAHAGRRLQWNLPHRHDGPFPFRYSGGIHPGLQFHTRVHRSGHHQYSAGDRRRHAHISQDTGQRRYQPHPFGNELRHGNRLHQFDRAGRECSVRLSVAGPASFPGDGSTIPGAPFWRPVQSAGPAVTSASLVVNLNGHP